MKALRFILPVFVMLFGVVACKKAKDIETDFSDLKGKAAGMWIEFGSCKGCRTVEFSSNELILRYTLEEKSETMPYTVISADSIQVKRKLDNNILYTTRHGVVFNNDGTLELKNFIRGDELIVYDSPSDVVNFHDLLLKKAK